MRGGIEHEANLFAMELLMPREMLLADLDKVGDFNIEDETTIKKLAKRYRVSEAVMFYRICTLDRWT